MLREEEGEGLEDRNQDIVCGRSHRGVLGRAGGRAKVRGVWLRAAIDAVQCVMNRDMHHRVHARFLWPVATDEARGDTKASPALAFQAMTAFAPGSDLDAVALAKKHPRRQAHSKSKKSNPHGAHSSSDEWDGAV